MEEKKNHIDDYFKGHLTNLDKIAPQDVWQGVERKLDNKRRIPAIIIFSSMAAGIAIIIGLTWVFQIENKNNNDFALKVQTKKTNPEVNQAIAQNHKNNASQNIKESLTKTYPNNTARFENPAIKSSNSSSKISVNNISVSNNKVFPRIKESIKQNPDTINNENYLSVLVPKGFRFEQKLFKIEFNNEKVTQPIIVVNNLMPDDEKPEKPKIRHWSIQGQVAPTYAYRNVTQTGANASINEYNNEEEGILAYSALVKVNYKINKNFSIQSGLGYSMLGYSNNDVEFQYFSVNPNTLINNSSQNYYIIHSSAFSQNIQIKHSLGLPSTSNNVNGNFEQEMKFVEIPFLVRYRFIDSKVSLQIVGGLGTQLLVSSNGSVNVGSSAINITEGLSLFHTLNLSSSLGIGINYRLLNQAVLVIEPTYKYFINSITTNSNSVHPYSFGIYTGLNFNF